MTELTEQLERSEQAEHHAAHQTPNRRIALMIAVFALLLAFAEMGVKNSQTGSLASNVEASNLWAFYQAKTIRQTNLQTSVAQLELALPGVTDPAQKAAMEKQIATWKATIDRYESEPKPTGGEGRKELMARAQAAEAQRELYNHKHEWFEFGAAALQIAIVLASAAIITGMMMLVYGSGLLGLAGGAMILIGAYAPRLMEMLGGH